eukprot:2786298-Rhodomonas_salina.2
MTNPASLLPLDPGKVSQTNSCCEKRATATWCVAGVVLSRAASNRIRNVTARRKRVPDGPNSSTFPASRAPRRLLGVLSCSVRLADSIRTLTVRSDPGGQARLGMSTPCPSDSRAAHAVSLVLLVLLLSAGDSQATRISSV